MDAVDWGETDTTTVFTSPTFPTYMYSTNLVISVCTHIRVLTRHPNKKSFVCSIYIVTTLNCKGYNILTILRNCPNSAHISYFTSGAKCVSNVVPGAHCWSTCCYPLSIAQLQIYLFIVTRSPHTSSPFSSTIRTYLPVLHQHSTAVFCRVHPDSAVWWGHSLPR